MIPDFCALAEALATFAHCRYCAIDGFKCPDDVREQTEQIRSALIQAWLDGSKAGATNLAMTGSVKPTGE